MRPLKSFGISQQFNYPKDTNNRYSLNSYNSKDERTRDQGDLSRYSATAYQYNSPTPRISSTNYKPQYHTTPGRGIIKPTTSAFVPPFYESQKPKLFSVLFQSEKYLEADFKGQIRSVNESQVKSLGVDLLILLLAVYIPISATISWSIGFLLFCVGGVNIYFKSTVGVSVPISIQVIFNFILIVATIDRFLSFDPEYQVPTKLLFSVPITLFLLCSKWQQLFISKIPIDSWNKWLITRIIGCLFSTFKEYLNIYLLIVCTGFGLLCGGYQLLIHGVPFEDLTRNIGQNILIKILMFYPIYYTIQVSNIIQQFSKNTSLSKTYKELRLFLWLFRIKDNNYNKYHFKAIKHLNQIISIEKDILERQLPLKSKNQQYYWDIIISFTNYFLQEILTFNLPKQKSNIFQDIKVIKSRQGLLDDLTIYFKKMNSFIGLNLQNIRIRQSLELTAALCNIFVKSKAYQMEYGGRLTLNHQLISKIVQVYKYFDDIINTNQQFGSLEDNNLSKKLVDYLRDSASYLSDRKVATSNSTSLGYNRQRERDSEDERGNPRLRLFR